MEGQSNWKRKFRHLFHSCQDELRKTTVIGKKMLTASKTNAGLHEAYEELGQLTMEAIKSKKLDWKNPKVHELVKMIERFQSDLVFFENEVQNIKEKK